MWWLDAFEFAFSMKDYDLSRVAKVMFGSSSQSPMNTTSRVQINELTLHGRDWRYLYLLAAMLFLLWSAAGDRKSTRLNSSHVAISYAGSHSLSLHDALPIWTLLNLRSP